MGFEERYRKPAAVNQILILTILESHIEPLLLTIISP